RNPLIHIPAGYMKLLDHPVLTWGYTAEPDPGVNGRSILYPRGRVLGGSSSINGMIYVRGQPEDFDHWGQLGNRGWSWDDVLPYFKAAENWEGGADDFHGTGGPLLTSRTSDKPALCHEIILAGGAIGSPHVLQLSGVGDPDHLGRISVPVAHALPGVGRNLQDHFLARIVAEVTGIPTANEKSRGLPFVGEVMRYVFAGT